MEYFCYFNKCSHYFKKQSKYFCFIALHLYRSFLLWLYGILVKPLENIVEKFLKNEPIETQWVQFYSLTTCTYTSDFGIEMFSFDATETYLCPLTNFFDLFVQNEYDFFIKHSVKQPKYDSDFEQIPEIIETLFVARNEEKYMFRTFPVLHTLQNYEEFRVFPEKSSIQFVIIEYKHPKMFDKIELKIPDSFYLVDNEILSPAFIQRMLELQRSFYIFDFDYEVMFIDDNLECKKLHSNNYVKIEKTSYTICTQSPKTQLTVNGKYLYENSKEKEKEIEEEMEIEREMEIENNTMKNEDNKKNSGEKGEEEIKNREPDEEEVEEGDHDVRTDEKMTPHLSNTFIFACCVLVGSVIPLAQILNNRCRFIG